MQTGLSPSVCRAFLGCQVEKAVDELNLTKKIISCHRSHGAHHLPGILKFPPTHDTNLVGMVLDGE